MTPRERLLLVFFKLPKPGAVKTRLIPLLGADGAATVHRRMTEETVAGLCGPERPWSARLTFAPDDAGPAAAAWLGASRDYRPQGEGDLGARLDRAFAAAFAEGRRRVVVVGTDAPDLSAADVAALFDALDEVDVVMAPAVDGGYAALGLSGPRPALFRDVPWSTGAVAETTRRKARAEGLRLSETRVVADVDLPEDWLALGEDVRARLSR